MTQRISSRLNELTASRDRYVAQLQQLERLTDETRRQIDRHEGAITELQALLTNDPSDGPSGATS
ncbi:MAG: hypothetical protein EPO21_13165 [Chloroflexota bacterium]|nr:MAG: hypothetical protein EPO21_13165 [Chloroflexota bacterium]